MLKLLLTTIILMGADAGWARKLEMPRVACKAAKLKLKDCHLQLGSYKVQVWNDKIFVHDGVHRGITSLALKESEWVEVSLQELAGRRFLEFVAWDLPRGESGVEAKKWFVYELIGERAILKLEKLVQRRKAVGGEKYNFDRLEKYGLQREGKKVKWRMGRESGYLD